MKWPVLQVGFRLRPHLEHSHWLGIIERQPYAARGRHRYVVHLIRLLALLTGTTAVGFALCVLGVWAVVYRPLQVEMSPWQVARLVLSRDERIGTSRELAAEADRRLAGGQVWRAHDLLVRALDLDPANLHARAGLVRQLEHEGFRPRALSVLEAGFSEGKPDADFLVFACESLAGAGDPAALVRLVPPALRRLPAPVPELARRAIVRPVVQAYLDLNRHADAIAFAREQGFEGDESLGATRLRARELLDRGRYAEATRLLGDLRGSGQPSAATSLLFLEAAVGAGDRAAALQVAGGLATHAGDAETRVALLRQLRRLLRAEGDLHPAASVPSRSPEAESPVSSLYRQVVDSFFSASADIESIALLAAFLGEAPDATTLRRLEPRYQSDAVRRRMWATALVDALMAEGDPKAALQLYLDQLGGKMQQADDPTGRIQSALLYYLNFSQVPLMAELGRMLAGSPSASGYSRAVRVLLANARWEAARDISALGLGLFPGNRELRALADTAGQAQSRLAGQEAGAATTGTGAAPMLARDTMIQQAESLLAARNGPAVLALLEQVGRHHPAWESEASEQLAWLRVRALSLLGDPLLFSAATGDYVGTDPARARRLHEWVSGRLGEAANEGWLAPVALVFRQRFPDLPLLGRWRMASPAGGPATVDALTEADELIAAGRLSDAATLLRTEQLDNGLPSDRRLDLLQRRLLVAVMLGRDGEAAPLATELVRQDARRARTVLLLAERQALLALDLARIADRAAPGPLGKSPWLSALQDAARTRPSDTPLTGAPSGLAQAAALLSGGQYEEAEAAFRQFGRLHPQVPPDQVELHSLLASAFTFASLQPEQARLAAAALRARQPDGPALVRALLDYHRRAQNETAIQALQSALSSPP